MANSVYRTMQGKEIDLDKLRIKNEMTLAVGNVKVNARGDELGPGGKIIKKREDVMTEYHAHADAIPTKAARPHRRQHLLSIPPNQNLKTLTRRQNESKCNARQD